MKAMHFLQAEIESENKNIDQTVSEHNFIRHLKNNTSTTFESTLIGANNRFVILIFNCVLMLEKRFCL